MGVEHLLDLTQPITVAAVRAADWTGVPQQQLIAVQERFPKGAIGRSVAKGKWDAANGGGVRHGASDPYAAVAFNATPFPDHQKKFRTWQGWFNYFYTELDDRVGGDREKFYREALTPDGKVQPPFDDASPDCLARRRDLLKRMFDLGFIAYPDSFFGTNDQLLNPLIGRLKMPMRIGFRGELRTPSQVKAHDGCRAKAAIDAIRGQMGMNEPWHPFTDPALRSKAYFRKSTTNADNCLFTVVSVATDFETASKFPLMQDLHFDAKDSLGTATVTAKGFASRTASIAEQYLKAAGGGTTTFKAPPKAASGFEVRQLLCVRMNVYLFTMPQGGWNTERFQSSRGATEFHERATLAIPWGNFLARVRCDRIQYDSHNSNAGHLLVVRGCDILQDSAGIRRATGGNLIAETQLQVFLGDILDRGGLDAGGRGGIEVNPGMKPAGVEIDQVLTVDAVGDWR